LHAICDENGKPVRLLLTAGNINDITGAKQLLNDLPKAKYLLADKGYDADWFRKELRGKDINPCIPERCNRKVIYGYDTDLYKKRHKVENMFAKLKDCRRIAMRFDHCAHTFFSAITLACICCFMQFMSPDPRSVYSRRFWLQGHIRFRNRFERYNWAFRIVAGLINRDMARLAILQKWQKSCHKRREHAVELRQEANELAKMPLEAA
jgi:putative transposase